MNIESASIKCPECKSTHVNKNGHKAGKQNHICVDCGRQFIDCYQTHQGYTEEIKRECLSMYVNGMGFRAIWAVKKLFELFYDSSKFDFPKINQYHFSGSSLLTAVRRHMEDTLNSLPLSEWGF